MSNDNKRTSYDHAYITGIMTGIGEMNIFGCKTNAKKRASTTKKHLSQTVKWPQHTHTRDDELSLLGLAQSEEQRHLF